MNLKFLRSLSWEEVFADWQLREEDIDWLQVARQKGFASWGEWRRASMEQLGASNREWGRYRILDPWESVPNFRVGPYPAWQSKLPELVRNTPEFTFVKLVNEVPGYRSSDKVQGMMRDFPKNTTLIGILMPDSSIVLLEGHHRATAIALAKIASIDLSLGELKIDLTKFSDSDVPLLDKKLARGTANIKGGK